ncbi:YraN family protein [Saprospira sp. CCB-QB6]|uniref:YraN family protein n=1 Tax=Saprospira sp. CCB-QB6 TaxID=3023936 RepID=UPI0023495F27|nr:YraN family protein [Saprospira sp. CCB-QB6]WCL80868.1 YraN family protein [Saprospira sp. CCB-QB6]
MAKHHKIGILGEKMALEYLLAAGYQLKAKNWRYGRAEVDLIVFKDNVLIFVEVKTRKNAAFGPPELAVTSKKQQLLFEAAAAYMYAQNYEEEIRFDVIAIQLLAQKAIKHFEDAFFPIWDGKTN